MTGQRSAGTAKKAGGEGREREWDWEFVQMLRRLAGIRRGGDGSETQGRKNLAAMGALRRGLGRAPGATPQMYPYVAPYLPPEARPEEEDAYFLIAALFAWHQIDWAPGEGRKGVETNFGASFRWLADTMGSEGIERRFVALLGAQREDLPEHLRHAVGLLRSKGIAVNWVQLLRDVLRWEQAERVVQSAWARTYWQASGPTGARAKGSVPAAGDEGRAASGERASGENERERDEHVG